MKQRGQHRGNGNRNSSSSSSSSRKVVYILFVVVVLLLVLILNLNQFKKITESSSSTSSSSSSLSLTTLPSSSSSKTTTTTSSSSSSLPTTEASSSSLSSSKELPNNAQKSRYAYITLISGIDNSFKYRGFLYACMIMNKALKSMGSSADFIALIGYNDINIQLYINDINLLKQQGIIVYTLHRLVHSSNRLSFAEMALLKVTPFNFTQYDRVQFFDGDVMPTRNMDCFFQLSMNTFTVGLVSPLNSGWYLGIPNKDDYDIMHEKSKWRLARDWDKISGWGDVMPKGMTYRGGKEVKEWEFNGADMDQGLLAHHFVVNKGNAILIDTDLNEVRVFQKGIKYTNPQTMPLDESLKCCNGMIPTNFFAHFTGRSKPWMLNLTDVVKKGRNNAVLTWLKHLDSLHMDINSSNIMDHALGSPLGFFNANFPKGGIK